MVLSAALSAVAPRRLCMTPSCRTGIQSSLSSLRNGSSTLDVSLDHVVNKLSNALHLNHANVRCFGSSGSGGGDDDNNKNNNDEKSYQDDDSEDPFGVHYQDRDRDAPSSSSSSTVLNVGPKDSLPPDYVRDPSTGKFTGEIRRKISKGDESLLKKLEAGGILEKERMVVRRLVEKVEGDDGGDHLDKVARGIREQNMALNTFGREVGDVKSAIAARREEDGADGEEAPFTAPLTKSEMDKLEKFMKRSSSGSSADTETTERLLEEADDLLPQIARYSSTKGAEKVTSEENPDLDLEWMKSSAHRNMNGIDDPELDDPFTNLMPSDLNPAKKVNRKNAKPIPKKLLHHNNLALIRRYVTPGGQIMNRVQSRLGAKDQRKIAKMVKRARHLGLIPYVGQWKVEDRGDVKEDDILEERPWEQELIERGLVERRSSIWKKGSSEANE